MNPSASNASALDPLSLVAPVAIPPPESDNGMPLMCAVEPVVRGRAERPLAVYVSVPFCGYKCHFCDWVADVPVGILCSDAAGRSPYVAALVRQIGIYGRQLSRMGYQAKYIYWGGGTPTRLGVPELQAVGDALREAFDLASVEQWTVESTPGDLAAEKLELLQRMGVVRVSLGVQSLDAAQLRRSGRGHSPEQAEAAITLLKSSGIPSFTVDVMTGLPGEDAATGERTLDRLIELGVPHFSVYPYRTSGETVLGRQVVRGRLRPERFERQLGAYQRAAETLRSAGYGRGQHHGAWRRDARHEDKDGNYKYALAGDKIGFGSGAESVIGHRVVWNPHSHMVHFMEHPQRFSYVERFDAASPELFRNYIVGALLTFDEGLLFDRFLDFTGVNFRVLLGGTWVRQLLGYIEGCGGRFLWTERSVRLDPECIDSVVVAHQSRAADLHVPAGAG